MTAREKAKTVNSLVILLQGVQGYVTTVELRNENSVTGTITHVDAMMNTHMVDATFKSINGTTFEFESFFVRGKNIRFVHIPDEVNILKTIQRGLNQATGTGDKRKRVFDRSRKLHKRALKAKEAKEAATESKS